MNTPKIIVITGPTATGKTVFGIDLAKMIDGEIVSADSMQVYTHMDIGTAKPTKKEMSGIPHYMIDVSPPFEDYSVARYVDEASNYINDILLRGKNPILVGGTGLYIDSLIAGRQFSVRGDNDLRQSLEAQYNEIGGDAMLLKLRHIDEISAAKLHANDKKRIVRAFESFAATGKTISQHDAESKALPMKYDAIKIALTFSDRADLYTRIEHRVDSMISKGLKDEVKALIRMGVSHKNTSMQAIGYKEIYNVIFNGFDMSDAIDKIKMESRRYAKRQLTWLRRDADVKWITWDNSPDMDSGISRVMELLHETK